MFARTFSFCIGVLLWASPTIFAAEVAPRILDSGDVIRGTGIEMVKADRDTLVLLGPWQSGAPYNGQFQTPGGDAAWNGWTHQDLSVSLINHWQVSDYNAFGLNQHGAGNLAAWCGDPGIPACDLPDTLGGYGPNWNDALSWTMPVADPAQPCTVTLEAWLNIDVEPGYDFVFLEVLTQAGDPVQLAVWDGMYHNLQVQASFQYLPGDYVGSGADEVTIRFRFVSDGAWDDEDCYFPGAGACQLDDVNVTLDNGAVHSFHDFQDGTLGPWVAGLPTGVGDFAQLRNGLDDLDPCAENTSYQVCFIDDGEVVPGTGGTKCQTWCYGPGGFIVNNTGGLLGDDFHLNNAVMSPVMNWPAGKEGGEFSFDYYWHMGFGNTPVMAVDWGVRSTADSDPAAIEDAPWENYGFLFFLTGPEYQRVHFPFDDRLATDVKQVQVRFRTYEIGWMWGYDGTDGTPAPYFDNARVVAYDVGGPALSARPIELAADAFPASGELDLMDPASCSVRFDMGRNVASYGSGLITPGDSLVVRVAPVGGTELVGMPQMFYHLDRNPIFDPYRSAGLPDVGSVEGVLVTNSTGAFAFDLPDQGFLFPGDRLRYYFRAEDDLGRISILPADTTGFSGRAQRADVIDYEQDFDFQALPSLDSLDPASGPKILFWNDSAGRGNDDEWMFALENQGWYRGQEMDVFRAREAYSNEGNGLGGRATLSQIEGYTTILYSCGREIGYTLGTGNPNEGIDPDLPLLDAWLRLGDRNLLLTGNQLASDLNTSAAGRAFLNEWMGVGLLAGSHTWGAGLPQSPEVVVAPSNPVLNSIDRWIAFGGCPYPADFDVVEPIGAAIALARFTGSSENVAAMTWNPHAASGSNVVSMPYDLSRVWDPGVKMDQPASLAIRAGILGEVLEFFGNAPTGGHTPVALPVGVLRVGNFPNPFNPITEIAFDLPRAAQVSVNIYNLQGRLVTTLLDEERPQGAGQVVWNGTDSRGGAVASGTYFYRIRAGQDQQIRKMTLLK